MVPYFGDFSEDSTIYIPFNTFSSDDPTASVTVTEQKDSYSWTLTHTNTSRHPN